MNNYEIVKNTEWKEVEINGENKEIPINWKVEKVQELLLKSKGAIKTGPFGSDLKNKDIQPSGIKVYMQDNVLSNDFKKGNNYISNDKFETKLKSCEVFPFDILITARGTVGKFGMIPGNSEKGILHSSLIRIQLNTNLMKNEYALYVFNKSSYVKEYFNKILANTTIPALYAGNISDCDVLICSNNEQSVIAEILSEQEAVIDNIEQLINKYENRFQYLSDNLLSGKLRVKQENGETVLYKNLEDNFKEVEINGEMKEIPKDWEVEKLINLGHLFAGKRKKYEPSEEELKNNDIYFSLGGEHIGIKDFDLKNKIFISKDFFNKAIKGQVKENDILIIKDGATTGKNIFVKKKPIKNMLLNEHVYRYVAKDINPFYLYLLFNNKDVQNILPEKINGIIPSLNQDNFSQIETSLTKNLDEQQLIIKIINSQEEVITKYENILKLEKQKFNWLLDNLLSGKYLIKEINK